MSDANVFKNAYEVLNMLKKKCDNDTNNTKFIKIVYFDEAAAQDYIDIYNGGRKETTDTETHEKVREIVASLEGQFGGSINILQYLKASLLANIGGKVSNDVNQVLINSFRSTLLTDYINIINNGSDESIKEFNEGKVFAMQNSVSMYKSLSSYLNIIPKDQLPFDMQKLNEAILGERGYYEMLLEADGKKYVLRFNISAFRNNYTLVDLPKMELSFYGVKVGRCKEKQLEIGSEFNSIEKEEPTAERIIDGDVEVEQNDLEIYDIVLAGIRA